MDKEASYPVRFSKLTPMGPSLWVYFEDEVDANKSTID